MLHEVWEVYQRDTQECILFQTEALANAQTVFDEVDIIARACVELSQKEIEILNSGEPVYA